MRPSPFSSMKSVSIILAVVLLIGVAYFLNTSKSATPPQTVNASVASASVSDLCRVATAPSQDELTYSKQISQDPFVQYLRTAIDTYLDNTYTHGKYAGLLNGAHSPDNAYNELKQIDGSYLKSKFIVLQTDIAPGGGESIVLLFKDTPDQVFYAWVYDYRNDANKNDGYDLRGFIPMTDGPDIKTTQQTYINQICDPKIGL